MNKEVFPIIIAGAALACLGHLLQTLVPVISRIVYLLSHSSYSPSDFQLDLKTYFVIAYALLALGVVLLPFPRLFR